MHSCYLVSLKFILKNNGFDQLRGERTLYEPLRGNNIEQECFTENVSACAPPIQKLEPDLLHKKLIFSLGVKDTAPYWGQQLCTAVKCIVGISTRQ